MAALDRSSPMPLWAQVEADLKRRLDTGEFGDRFPTDHELVDEYGVSRHTVREAIRHLNRAGILTRERGRGTVVNHGRLEQPLGVLYSLFESTEAAGHDQRSEVLVQAESTDPVVATALGLEPDAPLFHLERLRWIDDEPLAIDRVWMPLSLARPLLDADFSHTALYVELERQGAARPTSGWERIAPVIPPPAERRMLQMRRGEAAFFVERSASVADTVIEWRTTTVRSAHYRFVSSFTAGEAPAFAAAQAAEATT